MASSEDPEEQTTTVEEYQRNLAAKFSWQEEEANLVFGGDDGKECTYEKGYLTRQAVFACVTCTPQGDAGFCLACSLHCHEGHEVLEIYTKRNCRCDCGNSQYPSLICKLTPQKDAVNTENVYNQNYTGLYCTCHRPYPDPEREEGNDETMFQCVVCEDWLHVEHLGLKDDEEVPNENDESTFDELICQSCATTRCSFLAAYPELQVEPNHSPLELPSCSPSGSEALAKIEEATRSVPENVAATDLKMVVNISPVDTVLSASNTRFGPASDTQSESTMLSAEAVALIAELAKVQPPSFRSGSAAVSGGSNSLLSSDVEPTAGGTSFAAFNALLRGDESRSTPVGEQPVKEKRKRPSCPVEMHQQTSPQRAIFLINDWREKLCRCEECMQLYAEQRVTFLLDDSDTVRLYEEEARVKGESNRSLMDAAEDSLDGFMQTMPRFQQVEVIQGYNDMASSLREYLAPFARSGATVTEENIRAFFDQLRSKRRRLD